MYAPSESEYQRVWDTMNNTYNPTHPESMEYLYETYIKDFCRRFVKCYTNKVLHFNTTVTFCGESIYAILKRQLGTSTSDFKRVVDGIDLLLTNEIHNHSLAIAAAQIQYSTKLRLPIFQQLAAFVTLYALKIDCSSVPFVDQRTDSLYDLHQRVQHNN